MYTFECYIHVLENLRVSHVIAEINLRVCHVIAEINLRVSHVIAEILLKMALSTNRSII